jgi:L-galactose dehydrogenase
LSASRMSSGDSSPVDHLHHRQLGQTDLQVSIIGFGASPLGNVFEVIDQEEGKRAVHMAVDEGINFFDVSPYYGRTLAEERLGAALQGRRHKVILGTKCGRYGASEFDFSAERVAVGVDESLMRLRTDYVDLLQVHDLEFGDLQQIVDETIPAMRRLQTQGKARYIGITGYPLAALQQVASALPVDVILSYCHYNLLADDLETTLAPFASTRGIGLINASPLHMGVLTEQGAPKWHPAPPEIHEAARRAADFCRSQGLDISQIALRFCFEYPRVATTLVGMSTQSQVKNSLSALRQPIDPAITQQVRSILAPVLNRTWPSGRPENSTPTALASLRSSQPIASAD